MNNFKNSCGVTNGAFGMPLWSTKGSPEHSLGTAVLMKSKLTILLIHVIDYITKKSTNL